MRRVLAYPWRCWPRLSKAAIGLAALLVLVVAGANAYVLVGADGEATSTVADLPHAQVAIVPGALVNPDGSMSTMLADRVRGAVALWRAGKVDKVLVSGDHHTWAYDEPDTMRKALVRDGVPPRDVFEDHAGFDTWATMVRARSIFGVRSAVVVRPRTCTRTESRARRATFARCFRGSRRLPTSRSTRRRWLGRRSRSRAPTVAKAGVPHRRPTPRPPAPLVVESAPHPRFTTPGCGQCRMR